MMDTIENAQRRAEYWKAEHLAAPEPEYRNRRYAASPAGISSATSDAV